MCLIAVAIKIHPRYPLIIAENRDEFYHRPTVPLAFWPDHPNLLAGRDLQGGGTWLGITKTGRIAAITNFREPASIAAPTTTPPARSRGLLVSNYLTDDQPPEHYLKNLKNAGADHAGFNLVVGDIHQLWWYSNKSPDIVKITPGMHAISNHLLDTPWPKTQKAMSGLDKICRQNTKIDVEAIFSLLADTTRPPDADLPNTGVGLEWERLLSSVFVSSDIYGTRSSAVILVHDSGHITFAERTFKPGGDSPITEATQEFNITVRA